MKNPVISERLGSVLTAIYIPLFNIIDNRPRKSSIFVSLVALVCAPAFAGEIWHAGYRSSSVGIFDESTLTQIGEIPVAYEPADVDFSADGAIAFIVPDRAGLITVANAETRQITNTIDIGLISGGQIERRPGGSMLYVGNCGGRPELIVIDGDSSSPVDLDASTAGIQGIVVPVAPWKIAFSPDGQFAYASACGSNTNGGQVLKVDLEQNAFVISIPVQGFLSNSIAVSDDGAMAISAGRRYASIIDLTTDTEVGFYHLGSLTSNLDGVAIYKARQRAYVLERGSRGLYLLELDISNPANPFVASETLLNDPLRPGFYGSQSLRRVGDVLYVSVYSSASTANSEILLVDISATPAVIQSRTSFGETAYSQVVRRPDIDSDGDGVIDAVDNCPALSNEDQTDSNGDGFGDACVDPTVIIPNNADVDPTATVGAGSTISQGVIVEAGVDIGTDTSLDRDVTVGANTVIGNNVGIDRGVFVGPNVTIGDNVMIARDVIIDEGAQIGEGVVIEQGVFIGAGAVIGDNVNIEKGASIAPGSIVPDGSVVSKNATFGTVNYDEQRDGDIEGEYGLGPVFELGLGVNTVAGIGNGPDSGDDLFDFDVFSIVIPSGRSLTSISLDNWGTQEPKSIFMRIRPCAQPTSCSFQWSVIGGRDPFTGQQATDASIAADVAAIPLNFSEYTINNSGQLVEPGVPYVWTFVVE